MSFLFICFVGWTQILSLSTGKNLFILTYLPIPTHLKILKY